MVRSLGRETCSMFQMGLLRLINCWDWLIYWLIFIKFITVCKCLNALKILWYLLLVFLFHRFHTNYICLIILSCDPQNYFLFLLLTLFVSYCAAKQKITFSILIKDWGFLTKYLNFKYYCILYFYFNESQT